MSPALLSDADGGIAPTPQGGGDFLSQLAAAQASDKSAGRLNAATPAPGLSHLSDEDLEAIAAMPDFGQVKSAFSGNAQGPTPNFNSVRDAFSGATSIPRAPRMPDLSSMSDEDLEKIAAGGGGFLQQLEAAQGLSPQPPQGPLSNAPNPNPILRSIENFVGVEQHLPASITGAAPASDDRNPFVSAVTDIPSEIGSAAKGALSTINANLNPFSTEVQAAHKAAAKNPSFWGGMGQQVEQTLGVGAGLAAIPALAASPLTGAARSVLGHGLAATMPGESYEQGKQDADLLVAAMGPGKSIGVTGAVPPSPAGPFGVIKSVGQTSGDLGQLQTESAATMGNMGPRAQKVAQAFNEQQKAQLDAAQGQVASSLSPSGATVAETPQEAGAVVSQGMQSAAANAKSAVKAQYDVAKAQRGEIDASVFGGGNGPTIGNSIKSALSAGTDPVIVDDRLTPYASAMLQDLDANASKLNIPNRAGPLAPPSPSQITGVTLSGVDQWRKRLSSFRTQAYQSGNMADGRAASAVLDAFDNHIDTAVNNGMFNGNPLAVQAWNDARASYADYRSTFTAGKNDPVGRVVQKIIGDRNNDPAIGNDVADFLYGGTGTNPGSLNVGVANRVKSIFGDQSPEWTAVKQGLFNRLTKPTAGTTEWGSQRIANNMNKFLNGDGKEMANAVFSPAERDMIQSYGDLHQSLVPPPGSRNPSGTSPFVVRAMNAMGSHVGEFAGAALGHMLLPGVPEVISAPIGAGAVKGTSVLSQAIQARKIARQMPTASNAMRQWQIAAAKAQGNYGPQTARALAYASARLQNSLQPFGISLRQALLQTGGAGATNTIEGQQQGQQSRQQPQRRNSGNATYQNSFAHGGRVTVDPNPTEAQKAVGNYKKHHIRVHGLDDCYIGPDEASEKVFVVDQKDMHSGKFDEHKAMIGFKNREAAIGGYCQGFSDGNGPKRIMKITPMSVDEFKAWLASGKTKGPIKQAA